MSRENIFAKEEKLRSIRKVIEENKGLTISVLSRKFGKPKTSIFHILNNFLVDVIIYNKIGKFKYISIKQGKGQKESAILKRADVMREAQTLRNLGKSYSEIESEIKDKYKIKFDSGTLSRYIRETIISDEGKNRLIQKIKGDRRKANKASIEVQRKKGILGKAWPLAVKASIEVNTKKISLSSKQISIDKAKLLGHCMFDGSVMNSKGYNVVAYCSKFKEQVDHFADLVKKIYNFDAAFGEKKDKKGNIVLYCRVCSKELVSDLFRYTPSFSTRAEKQTKVPDEILNGPVDYKIAFLQAFWDDEGAVMFYARKGKDGYIHKLKKLEGYCENSNVLTGLLKLHNDLSINAQMKRKRIIISEEQDLVNFRELINFSPYARVGKEVSSWFGVRKRDVLDFAIKDFDNPKKVFVKTYGCTANVADSEIMKGRLFSSGFDLVDNESEADIVVINSCGVKNPTEVKILRYANEVSEDKKVVFAGCLTNMLENPPEKLPNVSEFLKANQPSKIVQKVASIYYNDKSIENIKTSKSIVLPVIRHSSLIAPININYGCLSACTFCSTKKARGTVSSFSIGEIYAQASKAVKEGAKEIQLTSQDTATYGKDRGTNLVKLLLRLVEIEGDFKLRVGMGNPKYMLDYLDDLISIMKHPKIFKFIHVPLQSGSDKVLKDMNRGYKASDFVKIVDSFRKEIPEISIATDIICGYPTETEKDFEETITIIKKTKPDMVNYSRFWPRNGTPASKLKQLNGKLMKNRCSVIMNLFKKIAFENNKELIGKKYRILITEKGKNNTWVGKNDSYKQIVVKGNLKIGQNINVKIKDASALDLKGEICD